MRAERDRTEWAVTAQAITEEHYMKGYCVSKTLQLYGTEPVNSQWTLLFCCTRDCSMSARNLRGKNEPGPCIMYTGLAQSTKPKECFFVFVFL